MDKRFAANSSLWSEVGTINDLSLEYPTFWRKNRFKFLQHKFRIKTQKLTNDTYQLPQNSKTLGLIFSFVSKCRMSCLLLFDNRTTHSYTPGNKHQHIYLRADKQKHKIRWMGMSDFCHQEIRPKQCMNKTLSLMQSQHITKIFEKKNPKIITKDLKRRRIIIARQTLPSVSASIYF